MCFPSPGVQSPGVGYQQEEVTAVKFKKLFRDVGAELWREETAVLTFEWVMLLTLLVIGIVSGLTAARDAIISELGDVAEAAISIDQSFTMAPFELNGDIIIAGINHIDTTAAFTHCDRGAFNNNPAITDCTMVNPAVQ